MYSIMLDKVSKSYQTNNYVVKAVNQADFAADKGTSVAIIGPSGSGKSTLLNMMGLIIYPDFGRILINGEDVTNLPDTALCHFRNSYFGYVVQDFALIERESVFNNIRIPLLYNKKIKRGEHKERIHRAAESLLIQDKLHRKVEQLSGGERQRVAIARALVNNPDIILADEPTGALDTKTSIQVMEPTGSLDAVNRDRVMDILMDLCNEKGKTLIIVTHDTSVAERCDRIIRMKDGQITDRAGE